MSRPTLSLVLPVYNEQAVIPLLHERLQGFFPKLGVDTEVIFVDDGSNDHSLSLLRDLVTRDPRYKVLSLSRNFGHGNAITAGVDYARGEAVVIMDADLQDPPEVITEMMDRWREGYDVVYGQRLTREGETPFKLVTSRWFYRVLRALVPLNVPLDTGDFRLMSRQVVVTLRALRETHRFIRGIVSWVGFRQTAVAYHRPSRAAGETKYPVSKMVRLALDAITSFSVLPLRFATYLGIFISMASVVVAIWAVVEHFVFHATVPGWSATVALVALLSSVQLLMIGILGEYVGRIYEQVKGRPLYVVGEALNLSRTADNDEFEPRPYVAPPAMLPLALPVPMIHPAFPALTSDSAVILVPDQPKPPAAPGEASASPPVPVEAAAKEASALPPPVLASLPSSAPAHPAPPRTAPSSAPLPASPSTAPPASAGARRSIPPPVPPPRSKKPMKGTLMGIVAPMDSAPPPPVGRVPHGIDVPPPSASASPPEPTSPPAAPSGPPPGIAVLPVPGAPLPPQFATAPMQPIPGPAPEAGEEQGSK
jgi:dolichol-phosphate mannosyltransferase